MKAPRRPAICLLRLLSLLLLLVVAGCRLTPATIRVAWDPIVQLNDRLPAGVEVFSGEDPSVPIRAWYVRVDERAGTVKTRVVAALDADGVETVGELSARIGALVAINGGYFRVDSTPATHVGLLLVDHELLQPPLTSVVRDGQRYYLARASLGMLVDGSWDVAWVSGRDGELFAWPEPPANSHRRPGPEPDLDAVPVWPAIDAVAAGPALIVDGVVRITVDEEVFFGSAILVHPRTAVGIRPDGVLILLVVDGRQRDSRGVDLVELATIMRDLGCIEALNLDGGWSSTLVVAGELVNRPRGGAEQREVMSALTVLAK